MKDQTITLPDFYYTMEQALRETPIEVEWIV